MANKKKITNNNKLYKGLDNSNFENVTSNTIFSFGNFVITSNFDDNTKLNDGSDLNTYLNPITIDNTGGGINESDLLYLITNEASLNLDFSDLNTYVRFGSAFDFIRTTVEKTILNYPASLFINSKGYFITINDYQYSIDNNESTFSIPTSIITNAFNLIYNNDNLSIENGELKNLNLSFDKYQIWVSNSDTSYKIIGFSGSTQTNTNISLKVSGDPFQISGNTTSISYHIKPNENIFKTYKKTINKYQEYILSNKVDLGFKFNIKLPKMLDNGDVTYINRIFIWNTSDGYNIDINTPQFRTFLQGFLNVGKLYDEIKTNVLLRLLTPSSLKLYDLTDNNKLSKLIKTYGAEFDKNRQYIDSIVYLDRVTYDKINNTPDQLINLLANQNGWTYNSIINDSNLTKSLFILSDTTSEGLLPYEVNIELWRRIIINSNYYWKSKGTRESILSLLLLLGIPNEVINIKEYVYNITNQINVDNLDFSPMDFPTAELPYDSNGYPSYPTESNNFYFQLSGDTDSGQSYFNNFRVVGFDLEKTIDNKKSWVSNLTNRSDDTTPTYKIKGSDFVVNSKEIDVAIDSAQGVEYDVFYSKSGSTLNSYLTKGLRSDITSVNFIEFMNTILTEMINASDFKIYNAYYQLVNIYIKYFNEFESNGYTFNDIYSFLSKYDIYLNTFINTLLPATAIKKNVGINIKNTNFVRQKFQYKRGVYLKNNTIPNITDVNQHYGLGNDECYYKREIS